MPRTSLPASLRLNTASGKAGAVIALTVAMLSAFEGTRLVGWHDKIDPPGVNTVCTGHTENVKVGERHTADECAQILADDIPRYKAMVDRVIHVPMPPHRYAAIISFTYNVGEGNLRKSSVARYLNAGDVQAGCDALLRYDRANGRIVYGLERRRVAERASCLRND